MCQNVSQRPFFCDSAKLKIFVTVISTTVSVLLYRTILKNWHRNE